MPNLKLTLQRAALAAYSHAHEYKPEILTDHDVEEIGILDDDTMALFIWREAGEIEGPYLEENQELAVYYLRRAADELARTADRLQQMNLDETTSH
jgi:hypothetical protein